MTDADEQAAEDAVQRATADGSSRSQDPDVRLLGLRYFNGQGGELWRTHPPRVEYFDHDEWRWVEDDDLSVDHLVARSDVREELRPVPSFFPSWRDDGWTEGGDRRG